MEVIPSSRFGKDPVFPIRTGMRSFILGERAATNFYETIAKNLHLSGKQETQKQIESMTYLK